MTVGQLDVEEAATIVYAVLEIPQISAGSLIDTEVVELTTLQSLNLVSRFGFPALNAAPGIYSRALNKVWCFNFVATHLSISRDARLDRSFDSSNTVSSTDKLLEPRY